MRYIFAQSIFYLSFVWNLVYLRHSEYWMYHQLHLKESFTYYYESVHPTDLSESQDTSAGLHSKNFRYKATSF